MSSDIQPGMRLCYDSGETEISESARAIAFGKLAESAMPFIELYVSDLYHDANWVRENVVGKDVTFYFGARKTGTGIGFHREEVKGFNEICWEVRVWMDDSSTRMTMDRLA